MSDTKISYSDIEQRLSAVKRKAFRKPSREQIDSALKDLGYNYSVDGYNITIRVSPECVVQLEYSQSSAVYRLIMAYTYEGITVRDVPFSISISGDDLAWMKVLVDKVASYASDITAHFNNVKKNVASGTVLRTLLRPLLRKNGVPGTKIEYINGTKGEVRVSVPVAGGAALSTSADLNNYEERAAVFCRVFRDIMDTDIVMPDGSCTTMALWLKSFRCGVFMKFRTDPYRKTLVCTRDSEVYERARYSDETYKYKFKLRLTPKELLPVVGELKRLKYNYGIINFSRSSFLLSHLSDGLLTVQLGKKVFVGIYRDNDNSIKMICGNLVKGSFNEFYSWRSNDRAAGTFKDNVSVDDIVLFFGLMARHIASCDVDRIYDEAVKQHSTGPVFLNLILLLYSRMLPEGYLIDTSEGSESVILPVEPSSPFRLCIRPISKSFGENTAILETLALNKDKFEAIARLVAAHSHISLG